MHFCEDLPMPCRGSICRLFKDFSRFFYCIRSREFLFLHTKQEPGRSSPVVMFPQTSYHSSRGGRIKIVFLDDWQNCCGAVRFLFNSDVVISQVFTIQNLIYLLWWQRRRFFLQRLSGQDLYRLTSLNGFSRFFLYLIGHSY